MNRKSHSLTPEVRSQKPEVRSQRSDSVLCPLSFVLCLLFSVMIHTCPAPAAFRAAIVLRDVTPDSLLPVSGGVGPSEPVDRKIGELTVRALVLEKDNTRVAICSTDFLGFPGVLCSRVRQKVSGIPPENILIGAMTTLVEHVWEK